jgi:hypothetical protein
MMSYRELKPKKGQALVLRKCFRKEGKLTSRNNFIWPEKGPVEAPDFEPTFKCGHGLHGLLWGAGSPGYLEGDTWLCVLVDADSDNLMTGQGELTDKCKFRAALDVSVGELSEIIGNIQRYAPAGTLINFAIQGGGDKSTQTAGDESTQTAGNLSTQTAGNLSTQTAGYKSTQTAGNWSTQTAGYWSTQTAGYKSTQTAGNLSTQTAGDESTQTAGYKSTQTAGGESTQTAGGESTQTAGNWSTQTAGYKSTQTAGYKSTQTAGGESTQTAGDESTFQAGINSVLIGRWWDGDKYCVSTMTIDEQTANKKIFFKQGVFTVQEPALEKAGE